MTNWGRASTGAAGFVPAGDVAIRRWRQWTAAAWVLSIVLLGAGEILVLVHHLTVGTHGYAIWLEPMLLAPPVTIVGWSVTHHRPGHLVGLLLLALALCGGVQTASGAYAHHALWASGVSWPGGALAALVSSAAQEGFVMLLVLLPVLFPDGRLPAPRWRLFGACLALTATLELGRLVLVRDWLDIGGVANPLAVARLAGIGWIGQVTGSMAIVLAVAAAIAPVVRYRRGSLEERLQLRWFATGAVAALLVLVVGSTVLPEQAGSLAWGLGPSLLPVAAGVAILRYRLYDIDRIVSRTLAYAIVVAVLVGVYAAGVLGLGAVARAVTGESGDLVVAVSTLLVAALFRPVVSRVRAVVDRRFNRAGVDAALAAEAFRHRLRDEVDLDTVLDDLRATVARTLAPSLVSVVPVESGRVPVVET